MPKGLVRGWTDKRRLVYDGLVAWCSRNSPPTMRELAEMLDISPQEAWRVCCDLVREGFAERIGAAGTKGRFKPLDNNKS